MRKDLTVLLFGVVVGIFLWIPNMMFAQCTEECVGDFCPLACVEGSKLETLYGSGGEGDLVQFFNRVFSLALTAGGILAVFRLAWAGYLYMTTDLWSSKERAKETLRETVLGLLLLIAVWVILNQINPDILKINVLETLKANRVRSVNLTPEQSASLQLYEKNVNNPNVPQSDYIPSLSSTPITGYYCYVRPSISPAQYACFTSASGCAETAQPAGTTCSKY